MLAAPPTVWHPWLKSSMTTLALSRASWQLCMLSPRLKRPWMDLQTRYWKFWESYRQRQNMVLMIFLGVEGRAWRCTEYHPCIYRRSQSCRQGHSRAQRQVDRNGLQSSHPGCVCRRPDCQTWQGDNLRGHLRSCQVRCFAIISKVLDIKERSPWETSPIAQAQPFSFHIA